MDNVSKKIVSLVTMDKRETGKKSTNMEKACFLKAMEDLEENGVHVSEVVTDAHLQIGAVMSKYLWIFSQKFLRSIMLVRENLRFCSFSQKFLREYLRVKSIVTLRQF